MEGDGGGACMGPSELVEFWVMHGMVPDETLHVFRKMSLISALDILMKSCRF